MKINEPDLACLHVMLNSLDETRQELLITLREFVSGKDVNVFAEPTIAKNQTQ